MKTIFSSVFCVFASLALASCGFSPQQKIYRASPEEQALIEQEYQQLLIEVLEESEAEPTDFKYSNDKPLDWDLLMSEDYEFPFSVCATDSDGVPLSRFSTFLTSGGADRTREEYLQLAEDMKARWESRGRKVVPGVRTEVSKSYVFTSDSGVVVEYEVGRYVEMIMVDSDCNVVNPRHVSPSSSGF